MQSYVSKVNLTRARTLAIASAAQMLSDSTLPNPTIANPDRQLQRITSDPRAEENLFHERKPVGRIRELL